MDSLANRSRGPFQAEPLTDAGRSLICLSSRAVWMCRRRKSSSELTLAKSKSRTSWSRSTTLDGSSRGFVGLEGLGGGRDAVGEPSRYAWTTSQCCLQAAFKRRRLLCPRQVLWMVRVALRRARSCCLSRRSCCAVARVFWGLAEAMAGCRGLDGGGRGCRPERLTWRGRRELPEKDWNMLLGRMETSTS